MGSIANSTKYPSTNSPFGSAIDLDSAEITGILGTAHGGTSASTASASRVALGLELNVNVQQYSPELIGITQLESTSAFGFVSRTDENVYELFSLSGGEGIEVTSADGTSGNPVISIDTNVVARLDHDAYFRSLGYTYGYSTVKIISANHTITFAQLSAADTGTYYTNASSLSSGVLTLVMPSLNGFTNGNILIFKSISLSGVTNLSATDATFDGLTTSYTLSSYGDCVTLQGVQSLSSWYVLTERVSS